MTKLENMGHKKLKSAASNEKVFAYANLKFFYNYHSPSGSDRNMQQNKLWITSSLGFKFLAVYIIGLPIEDEPSVLHLTSVKHFPLQRSLHVYDPIRLHKEAVNLKYSVNIFKCSKCVVFPLVRSAYATKPSKLLSAGCCL